MDHLEQLVRLVELHVSALKLHNEKPLHFSYFYYSDCIQHAFALFVCLFEDLMQRKIQYCRMYLNMK